MSITPLPSAPQPTDSTAEFNTKAFAWVAAIDTWTSEANALGTQVSDDADSASIDASTATTKAGEASASAAAALVSQNAAAASQTSATNSANAASASSISAEESANAAAISETNAGNSATQAANSAASAAAIVTGVSSNRPSIRPSLLLDFANTKQLDPRITFSRASTGTYYDGKTVVKAEENLLANSQAFGVTDTARGWNNTVGATITSSAETAPDGTSTATKFVANSGVTNSYVGRNNTGATVTNAIATIDLTNGTTSVAFGSFGSLSAAAVGNGWYRIVAVQDGFTFSFYAKASEYTFAGIQVTTNTFRLYASNQSGSTTLSPAGDGAKGILIWGAQLEQRSTVTAYTPTTTAPITNYIPALQTAAAGVARFDHNPVTGESLGLEIEEQRTNLLTYSEQFNDAAWNKVRSSVTSNIIVSPDGTLTGDKIIEDTTASNSHYIYEAANVTTGVAYTYSFYAKAAERSVLRVEFSTINTAFAASVATFDLAAGTVVNTSCDSASITPVGNGWYRCVATEAATATASSNIRLYLMTGGLSSYTGDGYSGLYIWGAQLEAGAFATSYIPTVASQVTRSADSASMTGGNFSSWYRADEGTLYGEYVLGQDNISVGILNIIDGTSNNIISMRYGSGAQAQYSVTTNGVNQANLAPSGYSSAGSYRRAATYKTDSFQQAINGVLPNTEDTSGTVPTVNSMLIGCETNTGTNALNGTIKRIAYYPKRLSNTELQGLTS